MIVWPTVHELQRVGPFSPLPSCISITYTVLCKAKCSKGPLHTSRWKVPSSSDDILPFPLIDILTQWPDHMERWHCREVGWSSVSILIIYAGQKGMKKPARLRICIPVKKIFRLPQWGHSSYMYKHWVPNKKRDGRKRKNEWQTMLDKNSNILLWTLYNTILHYNFFFFFSCPCVQPDFFLLLSLLFSIYLINSLSSPPPHTHTGFGRGCILELK